MNADLIFSQEIVHRAVGVQRTKTIQIRNSFHGNVFRRAFFSGFIFWDEFQGVVFSAEPTGIEKVVGFFHWMIGDFVIGDLVILRAVPITKLLHR